MSRSPSRDRSPSRSCRTFYGTATGGGGGAATPAQLGTITQPTQVTAGVATTASSATWSAAGLFDGVIGDTSANSWSASAVPLQWVQRQLNSPTTIDLYHIVARTGAAASAPSAWTLEGSANGSTGWVILDTRSGISWANGQAQAFTVANPGSYTYYRLNMTATQGGGTTWPSFTEWRLFSGSTTANRLCDWYSADAVTGIADGASVPAASIVDGSVNAHTFSSFVGTSAVRRAGTGYKNRTWIEHTAGGFNGATAEPQPSTDVTFFGIVKTSSSPVQGLMGGNAGAAYLRLSNSALQLVKDNVATIATSTLALPSNTWTPFIVTYTQMTGSTKFRVGASTETIAGASGASFVTTATRTLGRRDNITPEAFTGGWVELGRYAGVLSDADQTALWTYLTT